MQTTHETDGVVVDAAELGVDGHRLDLELDAVEAELARDVGTAQLHVHGHQLHGAHAAPLHRLDEVHELLQPRQAHR